MTSSLKLCPAFANQSFTYLFKGVYSRSATYKFESIPDSMGQLPHSSFSTEDLPEAERFSAWREDISLIFDIERSPIKDESPFHATFDLYQFGQTVIAEADSSTGRYIRSPKKLQQDGLDAFLVQLFVEGGVQFGCGRRTVHAQAGDIVIFDLAQPVDNVNTRSRHITAMWPREALEALHPKVALWHGHVLPRNKPAVKLLRQHLITSFQLAPHFSQTEGEKVEEATGLLVATALGEDTSHLEPRESSAAQTMICYQIKRHIRENLRSSQLSPEYISKAFGISRAQLYRIMEPVGGVSEYVRNLRLRRCLEEIRDPRFFRDHIAEIAFRWGFKHVSTFNRSFRSQFGMSPSDAREEGRSSASLLMPAETLARDDSRREHHQWFQAMGI